MVVPPGTNSFLEFDMFGNFREKMGRIPRKILVFSRIRRWTLKIALLLSSSYLKGPVEDWMTSPLATSAVPEPIQRIPIGVQKAPLLDFPHQINFLMETCRKALPPWRRNCRRW